MPLSKNDFIVNIFDLSEALMQYKVDTSDEILAKAFFYVKGLLEVLTLNLDIDPSETEFNTRIGEESNESKRKQTESTGRGETLQQAHTLHPE